MEGDAEIEEKPRKKGKDTLLLEAKDRQIADLQSRAKESEDGEDAAKAETIAAWKWTGLAWRNTFIGAHVVYAIVAVLVLGVNYLDLDVPFIGHLKLSRDAEIERAAPGAEAHNEAVETLEDGP